MASSYSSNNTKVLECYVGLPIAGKFKSDIETIDALEKETRLMLPIVNPILKVRVSDHDIYAHYGEVTRLHGACNASESFGELTHQAGKKGTYSEKERRVS